MRLGLSWRDCEGLEATGSPLALSPWKDEWINNGVYPSSGLYSGLRKEGNSDRCYNMDEP